MIPTIRPNIPALRALQQKVQDSIQKSFKYLIEVCENGFEKNFYTQKEKLEKYSLLNCSSLNLTYHQLLSSIESQDPLLVRQSLDQVLKIPLAADSIQFESIESSQDSILAARFFTQDAGRKIAMTPLSAHELRGLRPSIFHALDLIAHSQAGYDEALQMLIQNVWLCHSNEFRGASSFKFLGGIFLSVPAISEKASYYLAEWLVHESAHLHLHLFLSIDSIIENPISELYKSPLRQDLRPLIQLVHAAFVLARSIDFLSDLQNCQSNPFVETRLTELKHDFTICLTLLNEKARWTTAGKQIHLDLLDFHSLLFSNSIKQ